MTIFEDLAEPMTPDRLAAKLSELQGWVLDRLPTVDVNDPVLISIWLGPMAERLVEQDLVLESVATYGQLSTNVTNSITDDALAVRLRDELATSLAIEQSPASLAVGEVAIRLSTARGLALPLGTLFYFNGIGYSTTEIVTFRAAADRTNVTTERILVQLADGTWRGTVSVAALEPGSVANIAEGTELTPDQGIVGLVSVTASTAFVGGRDQNAMQDLIDAVFNHTAFRTLGTRDQIVAMLQTRTEIGSVRQCGVIGFGDAEMQRDKLFGLPLGGGCADIYLASADYPTTHEVVVEAVLSVIASGRATYRCGLDRDISPGYLRIVSAIDDATQSELTVISDQRGIDLSPLTGEQVPSLSIASHGSFSRFQTSSVVFEGVADSAMVLQASRTLRLRLQRINGLETAQQIVSSRTSRYLAGDTLVRAAIPIFLQISIKLTTSFDAQVANPELIRSAVVEAVMRRPMRARIYQSDIVQAISRYIPDDVAVSRVDFEGKLVKPDGSEQSISSSGMFAVPNLPDEQITPRTVAIYTVASAVLISVEQYVALETP